MTGRSSGGSSGRRKGGGGRGWTPRLGRAQRQNLLTALVISLSLLLCLQVCLFLPILGRQDGPTGAADRLLAVSNGGAAPEDASPWAAFHRLPRALGYTQAAAPPLPMWSPIKEDQLIGYSAHWDTRRGMEVEAPFVRLLATQIGGAGFGNFGFTCHFFFENGTRTADRPMSAAPFGRKGYFLFCPAKDLVTYTKREEPGKDGAVVISYDVDAPASVSTGCKEDKHCEGHWTFQIWGKDQLPHHFHEHDEEEQALRRQQEEAEAKASQEEGGVDSGEGVKKEQPAAAAKALAPESEPQKRVVSLPERGNLGICVRPAYGPWTSAAHLVQFLIYYLVAGAEHFTFYGTNAITPHMYKVIRKAQSLGVSIEVLPWNCQYSWDGYTMHEYNQYMGINACTYWQMPYFRHVAVIDIDEFLTPRHHEPPAHPDANGTNTTATAPATELTRFADYLDTLDARHPDAAGFVFQNNFFFPYDGSDPEFDDVDLPFDVFHVTERNGPFPHGTRSKVVVRPERVVSTEIHTPERDAPGFTDVHVPDAEAALFHYRRGDHMMSPGGKGRDLEMLRYLPAVRSHPLLAPLMEAVGENTEALASWTERVAAKKRRQREEAAAAAAAAAKGERQGKEAKEGNGAGLSREEAQALRLQRVGEEAAKAEARRQRKA